MTYFPTGGRILKRMHARYARLVTRDNNLFEVSKQQIISMMWAFLFALTGSTSVVTRCPRHSGTSTSCSGSRSALGTQENAHQTSKTCMMAGLGRPEKPTITPTLFSVHDHGRLNAPRMTEVLRIKRAFGPSTVEVHSFAGAHVEYHAIDHRAICACRPQLSALPFPPHIPHM